MAEVFDFSQFKEDKKDSGIILSIHNDPNNNEKLKKLKKEFESINEDYLEYINTNIDIYYYIITISNKIKELYDKKELGTIDIINAISTEFDLKNSINTGSIFVLSSISSLVMDLAITLDQHIAAEDKYKNKPIWTSQEIQMAGGDVRLLDYKFAQDKMTVYTQLQGQFTDLFDRIFGFVLYLAGIRSNKSNIVINIRLSYLPETVNNPIDLLKSIINICEDFTLIWETEYSDKK